MEVLAKPLGARASSPQIFLKMRTGCPRSRENRRFCINLNGYLTIPDFNPDISYRFVASGCKRAWIQGARSFGDENILNNMSRRQCRGVACYVLALLHRRSRIGMKYPG